MNNTTDRPEGKGGGNPYIWLRYATQFTVGGRTHTVEMGIPVPLGANAEVRAQLIREAEAGMNQLSSHVESRVNQMVQHSARPQTTASASTPAGAKDLTGAPQAGAMNRPPTASTPAAPAPRPTVGTTSEETQKIAAADKETDVPPTRTYVGASMPPTPRLSGDSNGNLTTTQFLHIIRATWGLTSQQAREMLQVQTLNGLDLREALERLQHIIAQKPAGAAIPTPKPQEAGQPKAAQGSPTPPASTSTHPPSSPTPGAAPQNLAPVVPKGGDKRGPYTTPPPPAAPSIPLVIARPPIDLSKRDAVSDKRPMYRFDEEDELEEDLDDTDDSEEQPVLSAQDRLKARNIINKMREVRSSTTANPGRLTVLQNVVGSQISEEQLQRLLQAFWGTATTKKLKVDQVEALISWAKEDDFVTEVEAVLVLLEEE